MGMPVNPHNFESNARFRATFQMEGPLPFRG